MGYKLSTFSTPSFVHSSSVSQGVGNVKFYFKGFFSYEWMIEEPVPCINKLTLLRCAMISTRIDHLCKIFTFCRETQIKFFFVRKEKYFELAFQFKTLSLESGIT